MPSGRRWGLICLDAACMLSLLVGACWDKLLYLLQGKVSDKVRVPDQSDVVSSLTEWLVGFSLNSCFPFLIHSETLKPLVFGSSSYLHPDPRTAGGAQFSSSLEHAGPSIWQILRPMQEGLCKWACVYLKTCCPTNSLPGEMGSGSWCCQFLGL